MLIFTNLGFASLVANCFQLFTLLIAQREFYPVCKLAKVKVNNINLQTTILANEQQNIPRVFYVLFGLLLPLFPLLFFSLFSHVALCRNCLEVLPPST